MKQLIATMLVSTGLFAGGSITQTNYSEPTFYAGVSYSFNTQSIQENEYDYTLGEGQSYSGLGLVAGANVYNSYDWTLAVEGRYNGSVEDIGADNWGIYAKAIFNTNSNLGLYGIAGYSGIDAYLQDYSAFGAGIGILYQFDNSFAVSGDWMYDFLSQEDGFNPEYSGFTASLIYNF